MGEFFGIKPPEKKASIVHFLVLQFRMLNCTLLFGYRYIFSYNVLIFLIYDMEKCKPQIYAVMLWFLF